MSAPSAITAGPDGNLWFTGSGLGRITTAGVVTGFPVATSYSGPYGITAGPDGNLWFTETNFVSGPDGPVISTVLARITTAGAVTEFPGTTTGAITSGPDGNLWFSSGSEIGRITTAGVVTEFPLPSDGGSIPIVTGITAGPDGNLWFVDSLYNNDTGYGGSEIGRITTAGVVTEFPIPDLLSGGISAGPDGNLWFTVGPSPFGERSSMVGRITPAGVVTEFPLPTPNSDPSGITAGPDGNLWFTDAGANEIGRITTAGVVTEFPIPTPNSGPSGITAGPDGNLWFTETNANQIGEFVLRPPTVEAVQRYGVHDQPTTLVLTLSTQVDATSAQDVRNYQIVGPGGHSIAVKSAVYDPSTMTITIRPRRRLNVHDKYVLTVIGTAPQGLRTTSGIFLNSGSDYKTTVDRSLLVVPGQHHPKASLSHKTHSKPGVHPTGAMAHRFPL